MRPLPVLRPALAALLAACVLLLGLAAWAPNLHACLHGGVACAGEHDHVARGHGHDHHEAPSAPDQATDEHACAVTLFAAGCDMPLLPLSLTAPPADAARVAAFTEFLLARTLRGPERVCGPPALA